MICVIIGNSSTFRDLFPDFLIFLGLGILDKPCYYFCLEARSDGIGAIKISGTCKMGLSPFNLILVFGYDEMHVACDPDWCLGT